MEGADYGINSLLNLKANTNQFSQSDVKMIKKFTLRPARIHLSRSVSPDSASVEIVGTNDHACQEAHFITSKEIFLNQLPDNHICDASPYISDDSFETANDEFSFTKDNFQFTTFQDSFPNISDTFLEKLGLHEDNTKQNLTKEQTEEKFATFAIQILLDSRDIKERLQKQKDRCVEQNEKFLSIIRDVSHRLRDHRCIGATDPISPVFVLLEDMKFLLRDITQSAQQLGILTCESRMMKCWNLVTNYVAHLKQDIKTMVEQTQMYLWSKGCLNLQCECHCHSFSQNTKTAPTALDACSTNHLNYLQMMSTSGNASEGSRLFVLLLKLFRSGIDQQSGSLKTSGTNFKNGSKQNEIDCSPSSGENSVEPESRCTVYRTVKNSVMLFLFATFLILILLISIQWQCLMTSHDNQICILDYFIKEIHIGIPPY